MKRPFASKRPFGPFVSQSSTDDSEFEKVDIQTNDSSEDLTYTVTGLIDDFAVGLVVETNTIMLNGESIAVYERDNGGKGKEMEDYDGTAGLEITASPGNKVKIGQADKNIVRIKVD